VPVINQRPKGRALLGEFLPAFSERNEFSQFRAENPAPSQPGW